MQIPDNIVQALDKRGYTTRLNDPNIFLAASPADDKGRVIHIQITPDERPQMFVKVCVTRFIPNGNLAGPAFNKRSFLDRSYIKTDLPDLLRDLNYLNF